MVGPADGDAVGLVVGEEDGADLGASVGRGVYNISHYHLYNSPRQR